MSGHYGHPVKNALISGTTGIKQEMEIVFRIRYFSDKRPQRESYLRNLLGILGSYLKIFHRVFYVNTHPSCHYKSRSFHNVGCLAPSLHLAHIVLALGCENSFTIVSGARL